MLIKEGWRVVRKEGWGWGRQANVRNKRWRRVTSRKSLIIKSCILMRGHTFGIVVLIFHYNDVSSGSDPQSNKMRVTKVSTIQARVSVKRVYYQLIRRLSGTEDGSRIKLMMDPWEGDIIRIALTYAEYILRFYTLGGC